MKPNLQFLIVLLLFSAPICAELAPYVGATLQGQACSGNSKGYGPYDYSKRHLIPAKHLNIVEEYHFTPNVENLIAGSSSGTPYGDLDYTLRAWPNHHRALLSLIRYQLEVIKKIRKDKSIKIPPECYLQRAIHFSPNDPMAYSLYGYYLAKVGQHKNAEKFYKKALELSPENSKIEYSYALLLIDLKRNSEAVEVAKKSYQHGHPPEGLKNKLKKIGAWKN
ncbi:TPR repeat-containing protein [Candidatus Methylobacter favarea]|uniref:TPR repeat-containing protein n=1 Tax=Candidatus Methylobacter favarea TaxID=2707345 RepID=A0A8S0X3J3_9GAMM|nr:CDC27 family protein [Candidatus Methylobacter favarea]CAA9892804.1 TPR repeat-containing protein [Candidatus Methylobacter favarea]